MTDASQHPHRRRRWRRQRVRTFVLFLFNMLPDFTTALQMLLVDTTNISAFGWGGLSRSSSGDIICYSHRGVDYNRRVCSRRVCCCRRYHHLRRRCRWRRRWVQASLACSSPLAPSRALLRPLVLLKPLCKTLLIHPTTRRCCYIGVLIGEPSRRRRLPRLRPIPLLKPHFAPHIIFYTFYCVSQRHLC